MAVPPDLPITFKQCHVLLLFHFISRFRWHLTDHPVYLETAFLFLQPVILPFSSAYARSDPQLINLKHNVASGGHCGHFPLDTSLG